jgi:hypothetical protein
MGVVVLISIADVYRVYKLKEMKESVQSKGCRRRMESHKMAIERASLLIESFANMSSSMSFTLIFSSSSLPPKANAMK